MKWQRGFFNVTMGEHEEEDISELVVNCFPYRIQAPNNLNNHLQLLYQQTDLQVTVK